MQKQTNKRPITIKAGRGVKAKIWENTTENGAWKNITITRTYKDDQGDLQDSTSFSRDDLLHVAYAAQKAFDTIVTEAEASENSE
ncbi:MAG: hypothetical protein ISQ06_06905 [Planctomycetaceae bacterium]|nr:hypothetical protein [Planctomycetaceae bacterium]